ncbi:carboxypeptidase-like regulatory domain-containing protein [Bremerella sp. JC817]|uniref:carboxypeptidase-like regulatory domain-containing protein n=1 Tax=Bremerella sp. JC817 TaxID=3231756 RepID=UPI00345896BF
MKRRCAQLFLLGIFAITGCGSGNTSATTGTVTLDGKPLPNAEVVFTPEGGGRPAVAETNEQGDFELIYTVGQSGAPPGKYVVRVRTATTMVNDKGKEVIVEEKVPRKYNDQTELVCEVIQGETNHFELDLKSDD